MIVQFKYKMKCFSHLHNLTNKFPMILSNEIKR